MSASKSISLEREFVAIAVDFSLSTIPPAVVVVEKDDDGSETKALKKEKQLVSFAVVQSNTSREDF